MLESSRCQRQACPMGKQVFVVENASSQIRPLPLTQVSVHRFKNPHPLAPLLGGHSVCAPPDPISNSAVKPDSADGTVS